MEFKVGDLIHITEWFAHKDLDHVAEVTRVDPGGAIWFEPEIIPKHDRECNYLSEGFFDSCVIERG